MTQSRTWTCRRQCISRGLFLLVACWLGLFPAQAAEPVRLQLKWHHQFQFAGYYAAALQGYYAEEGIEVEMIEGNAERLPIASVLAGLADFGVGDTDVLLERLRGKPLVVCAAIFQHSPYVIMSRAERNIRSPHDLIGASVMMAQGQGETQFRAMLTREGVDTRLVNIIPHSWDLDDLLTDRVDAMSAYATVEPLQLRRRGATPALLRTVDYGVDFYGDTLFTTENQIARQARRSGAFVRASLRGWEYALRNPEKIVDYILTLPGVAERGIERTTLLAEAEAMREYVLPDVVDIGHMNPGRWRAIADTFIDQKLVPATVSLEGFMPETERAALRRVIRIVAAVACALGAGVALVLIWNMQMRARVQAHTRELRAEVARRELAEGELRRGRERLKLAQAVGDIGDWTYDSLTGRVTWSETLFRLHARAEAREAPPLEKWITLYDHTDAARLRESLRRALERREEFAIDLRLRLPDGRQMFHHLVCKIDADTSEGTTRLHGIEQDVTVRKLAEERLRAQLRELERWREVTLGREERLQTLKREVNASLALAGQPPRYELATTLGPGEKPAPKHASP